MYRGQVRGKVRGSTVEGWRRHATVDVLEEEGTLVTGTRTEQVV